MDDLLNAYFELHDMLSDMIEAGRLTEGDIPEDYARSSSSSNSATPTTRRCCGEYRKRTHFIREEPP